MRKSLKLTSLNITEQQTGNHISHVHQVPCIESRKAVKPAEYILAIYHQ